MSIITSNNKYIILIGNNNTKYIITLSYTYLRRNLRLSVEVNAEFVVVHRQQVDEHSADYLFATPQGDGFDNGGW